jgi:AbrB family looped-hinge helix DNA binding protein
MRNGKVDGMRTTIDRAGRIVIPKRLRDELGLVAGSQIEMTTVAGELRVALLPVAVRLERRGRTVVIVPEEPVSPMSADDVRDAVERMREDRG